MDKRLYDLLQLIKEKPAAFYGKKSLDQLVTHVSGYIHCMYDMEGVHPEFLPGFQEYIEKYYNVQRLRHWSEIIKFFSVTEESAFDRFYEHVEEFLKEKE